MIERKENVNNDLNNTENNVNAEHKNVLSNDEEGEQEDNRCETMEVDQTNENAENDSGVSLSSLTLHSVLVCLLHMLLDLTATFHVWKKKKNNGWIESNLISWIGQKVLKMSFCLMMT